MSYKNENYEKDKNCKKYHSQGVTSYKMQDPKLVFDNLNIKKGDIVIDLGCGAGDYSFHAAEYTGERGSVYPCDKWPELKEKLRARASESDLKNIIPEQFDLIKDDYPFQDNFADFCFLITVLHIPVIKKYSGRIFSQVRRILKPSGIFAVINCKKIDVPFGPPIEMRLSSEETESLLLKENFKKARPDIDLGHNYMSLYS